MNIRTILQTTLMLISGLLLANAASAVELLEDGRIVRTIFDEGSTTTVPDEPFADFNVNYQNTTVSNTLFAGSGHGYGESDFFFFIAESTFDITFGVTETTDFSLSGTFAAYDGDFGAGSVSVDLYTLADPENRAVVYSDYIFGGDDGEFSYNEPLTPGVYQLVLHTNITPGGYDTIGEFDFVADFADQDLDDDGVLNEVDNCTELANPRQADTDGDLIGSQCDPDVVGDGCQVDFNDLAAFRFAFFSTPGSVNWFAAADLTGDPVDGGPDGIVNFADLARVRHFFFGQPGPSAGGCN